MEASEKRRIVEALILSSAEPLSAAKLAEIIPYCDEGQAKDLVNELNTEYQEQDRSFEIWEVAGGFQIRTRAEFSGYLQKLQKERALRLSQAALETLAIIAYRQPVTRAEVEDVRGVDAGATVKSLLERQLIRIAGQREVPGRPMLYGTSRRFLEVFGLERLKDLPTLRELDELAREQGLLEKTSSDAPAAEGEGEGPAEGESQAAGEGEGIAEGLDAAEGVLDSDADSDGEMVAKGAEGLLETEQPEGEPAESFNAELDEVEGSIAQEDAAELESEFIADAEGSFGQAEGSLGQAEGSNDQAEGSVHQAEGSFGQAEGSDEAEAAELADSADPTDQEPV
ncbi:MAG: SMC-Scp complex subunit ScpB [Myxococcota bacterium]